MSGPDTPLLKSHTLVMKKYVSFICYHVNILTVQSNPVNAKSTGAQKSFVLTEFRIYSQQELFL